MYSSPSLASADIVKVTMDDLRAAEAVVRVDPRVIEQCIISGVPKEDMHKVYCDGMEHVASGVRCL